MQVELCSLLFANECKVTYSLLLHTYMYILYIWIGEPVLKESSISTDYIYYKNIPLRYIQPPLLHPVSIYRCNVSNIVRQLTLLRI